MTSNYSHLK